MNWIRHHHQALRLIVIAYTVLGIIGFMFVNSLDEHLFNEPTSMVITDRDSILLSARIADDQQWRFPEIINVPSKFKLALIAFEDQRFYFHIGFDPYAFIRATFDNLRSGEIVSGASTISMQVIRLSRKEYNRSFFEKIIETILAVRLELSYSKDEILALYASHAPFGGNVVGLDAAAWRYFGRDASKLSWGEMTSLAVLPNQPSLVHLKRNRNILKKKRDRLLNILLNNAVIDTLTYELAMAENLPPEPKALPNLAPHLLDELKLRLAENGPQRITTSIDRQIQRSATKILANHHKLLSMDGIYNAAALIIDNKKNTVLAYIGNTDQKNSQLNHGQSVDIIQSKRSTGSILKPFLYAGIIQDGLLMPEALIADIPTRFGGFQPINFNKTYAGAVPANLALSRSLNIPAVRMLKEYGIGRFYNLLSQTGMTTLDFSASHYGLSLILGGAEATLWDIANMYSGLTREIQLNAENSYEKAQLIANQGNERQKTSTNGLFSRSTIYHIFEALTEVKRPVSEGNWKQFRSSKKIAWKTGTSYGFRDAWAIGVTPDYTVAVWVGNADGEGRPNIIGVASAAPVMFDLFDLLPIRSRWFDEPVADMIPMEVCVRSGYRASSLCDKTEIKPISLQLKQSPVCPYHQEILLDPNRQFQVNSDCMSPQEMVRDVWFVLPPKMEMYYKMNQANYHQLPKFMPECEQADDQLMEMIYPTRLAKIYIPIELDGSKGQAVFEVAHRRPESKIYWHLDNAFIGTTKNFHQLAVETSKGKHRLTLVDEIGNRMETEFLVESE